MAKRRELLLRATMDTRHAQAGFRSLGEMAVKSAAEQKKAFLGARDAELTAAIRTGAHVRSVWQTNYRERQTLWKKEEREYAAHVRKMDAVQPSRKSETLNRFQSAAGGLGSVAAPLVTAAAAQATFNYLNEATEKATALGEAVNLTKVIFKDSAASVEAWAKANATAMGQTETQVLTATGLYGNALIQAGVANAESARIAQEMTSRASDLASLYNTDLKTALEALQSGLNGESQPLRQFGVFMSEAEINASKFAQGLAKVPPSAEKVKATQDALRIATFKADEAQRKYGANAVQTIAAVARREKAEQALSRATGQTTRQLTEGEKVRARAQFILERSTQAAGDFAKTSDSAANKQRILTAEIDKLQTKIGQDLLPLKQEFLNFFKDMIPVAGQVVEGFHMAGGAIEDFIAQVERADEKEFGAGPGLKRFLDNLRAVKEILSLNWGRMLQEKTEQGKAATIKQDVSLFKERRAKLDEFYKLRSEDPNNPRVAELNRTIFDDDLYKRAQGYGVDTVRRGLPGEDYAILDHAIAESAKRDKAAMAALKKGTDAAKAAAKAVPTPAPEPEPKPTPAPTGGASTGSGGGAIYDGAAAERARAEGKRRQEEHLRDLRTAADTRDDTRTRREADVLGDLLNLIREQATPGTFEKLRNNAARHSKEIYKIGNDQALRDFETDKTKNPAAASAKLLADQYRLARELAERRNDILAATTAYETRIQEGAKKRAEMQDKQNEAAAESYRKFLEEVDAPELTAALEAAQKGGDLQKTLEASNALLDNAIRRADSAYYAALTEANGDPNGLAVAYNSRKKAVMAATKERDDQSARAAMLDALTFWGSSFADKPSSPEQAARIERERDANIKGREDATGFVRETTDGAKQGARALIRGILSGENGGLEEGFASLGEMMGSTIADYTTRRFLEGPMERIFDQLADRIARGGMEAGNAILAGASAMASVANLFAQKDGKKKKGGILGGLIGGVAGFFLGGPAGALTGFSAGSQLGQGNILGAGLTVLGGASTGAFSKGGMVGKGVAGLRPANFPVKGYAVGGFPVSGRRSIAGELGTELMFGDSGQVTALGVGGYASFTPSGRNVVLPAEASQRLVRAASSISGRRGTTGDPSINSDMRVNIFGDVNNGDIREIARAIKREREQDLLMQSIGR